MITLLVGDTDQYLADLAHQMSPDALAVSANNYKKLKFYDRGHLVAYVASGDLDKVDAQKHPLYETLSQADEIIYCPPEGAWSDERGKFSWYGQRFTIELLLHHMMQQGKTVKNFQINLERRSRYLELLAYRDDDQDYLWVSGGSDSHGVQVDPSERYGSIVSRELGLGTKFLTRPGASIEYCADQILRSDIRKNDIVIWGLTPENRSPRARYGKVFPLDPKTIEEIDYLQDETRLYKAITSIYQVSNFVDKIGCQFLLLPLCISEQLQVQLLDLPGYVSLPFQLQYIDYGPDNQHPGPQQHRFWADHCLDMIKRSKNATTKR